MPMLLSFARSGCLLLLFATALPAQRMAGTYASLQAFLDSCPQSDPYVGVIRRDFQILRDGVPAADIACTEPYTKMPIAQITEELTALQALRFAYYMDMGQSGYLPWTPLRLYDWFKSRVAGFNIDTTLNAGSVAAACCSTINGRLYMIESTISNDLNRMYRQTPDGMAAQVALIAHETRHSEGNGYPHVSCCGTPGGCDQSYDEKNISAFGVQYYLAKQWLTGAIDLGYSCDPALRAELASAFMGLANVYPSRFCDTKPATLSIPATPGGACIAACTLTPSSFLPAQFSSVGGTFTATVDSSASSCGWTSDSTDSWLFPVLGMNSAGSGTASYGFSPNQSPSPRIGTAIAAGSKLSITQAGCSPCAPTVAISSVVSAAPYVSAIAGGSWVTIYGTNLAATTRQWGSADFANNKLPLSIDGVSVRIDGQPAAVYYISPTQINVQAPDDGATGPVVVQAANQQGAATSLASLQKYAPAFFLFGEKYVAAIHADGTSVGSSSPAHPDEVVSLFGTGFGPTNPPSGAGVIFNGTAPVAFPDQLTIRIGGQKASVQFAGLTAAGLYQLNVVIPNVPDGNNPISALLGGVASPATTFIAIQH